MLRSFIIIALLHPFFCLGQDLSVPTVDQFYPSPPNAASIAKYSEIPVDKFSGTSNISIPIYTLTEGELSVPVSLNYHTGGIKVTEVASWVGLGWSLSVGGSITRQVNGSIDEGGYKLGSNIETQGWYSNGNTFSDDFIEVDNSINNFLIENNCNEPDISDTETKQRLSEEISSGIKDTEPDIFYLNIPGYNGKFYFNENQEIIFDPFQNIKVEEIHTPNSNNNDDYSWFTGFNVTTPDGTKYYFGNNTDALDRSFSYPLGGDASMSDQIVNTWHLTSIESLNDDYQINFEYEKQLFFDFSFNGASVTNTSVYNFNPNDLTITATEEARLKRISSTHSEILFTPKSEVREDLLSQSDLNSPIRNIADIPNSNDPKLLNMIEVNTNGGCVAKFSLNHDYFENGSDAYLLEGVTEDVISSDKYGYTKRRPKLSSLVQTSCTSDETFMHEFSYKDGPGMDGDNNHYNRLPSRLSFQQDHWGYYTNALRTGIFPDLYLIPEAVVQGNGNYNVPYSWSNDNYISNRSANENFSGALSLTGITYPTGAQILIETEGNTISRRNFNDVEVNSTVMGQNSNCSFGSSCCENASAELLDLSWPGPVINNGTISYYSLEAKITSSGIWCDVPDIDEYQGFLVVERIDPGGVKKVFSEHINLPVSSINNPQITRAFGLGLTENVRQTESPACWWNPSENYNIYFYKGANELDIDRQTDPIKLTLEIKMVTATIDNTEEYQVGGRRVSRIVENDGTNAYTTDYSYVDEENNSSGIILDFPKYVFFNRVKVPIQCNINPPYEFPYISSSCNSSDFIFRSSPVFPLTSTIGSSIGYREVTTSKTGGEDVGKTVCTFIADCVGNEENHYPESWFSLRPKKIIFPKISKLIGKIINEKQIAGNSKEYEINRFRIL